MGLAKEAADVKSAAEKPVTVYGLASSENGEIRYIGQTIQDPRVRYKNHMNPHLAHRHWPVYRWIQKVRGHGHSINMVVLVENAMWGQTEIDLIALYRAKGTRLFNCTDGGDGVKGRVVSDDTRAKISAGNCGKPKSESHKAKLKIARAAYRCHPNAGAKVSAALKGKRPKNLDSLRSAKIGKPRPPEVREKLSKSLKGRKAVRSIEHQETLRLAVIRSNMKRGKVKSVVNQ